MAGAVRNFSEPIAICPHGVDLYFDDTGGPISATVTVRLSVGPRVVI